MESSEMQPPIVIFAILVLVFFLILFNQGNPTQFFLFPILLVIIVNSWYLHKEIHKEHDAHLMDAKTSFRKKLPLITKQPLFLVILASGAIVISFTLFWSFFINGLIPALLNTGVSILLFVLFLFYSFLEPKDFIFSSQHFSIKHRRHLNYPWFRGYIFLLPFAILCYLLYSLIANGGANLAIVVGFPKFLFFYTLLLVCLSGIRFVHHEYQREEENLVKKTSRKIFQDND